MRYLAPSTVDEATALLARCPAARVLAGGTDIIPQMQAGRIPEALVDIKRIPELRALTETDGRFEIGAAVTGAELSEHARLGSVWPGLVEAFDLIGSTQIQSRATLGGNLCNASPAADSVPALIAADALCRIAGPSGLREAPVADIVVSPGRTSLRPGEFIVSFMLPVTERSADAYLRLIPRTEMDIAVVGAAAFIQLAEDGTCAALRIALGAVGPAVVLATDAARQLVGTRLEPGDFKRFAGAIRAVCRPINDRRGTIEYRTDVAAVLAQRSVRIAWDRAQAHSEGLS